MSQYVEIVRQKSESQRDLKMKLLQVGSENMWMVAYESIVDWEETILYIWNSGIAPEASYSDICSRLTGKEWSPEAMDELLQGQAVFIDAGGRHAFSFQGKLNTLTRAVSRPENESMPYAPAIAFMEPLATNIGILRKMINSPSLTAEGFQFTGVGNKEASLIYLTEHVDQELLQQVKSALQKTSGKAIHNGQELMQIFGYNRLELLAPYYKTEVPSQAVSSMTNGRVLLMMDGEPVAYVLPLIFSDFIALEWDKQFPLLIMLALRFLRLVSLLVALLTPGLYVALVSVNPETLRIELALSIATSRIGIPLPTFLEMLLLLIISEISIEATQRLPKSIAGANTVIGGIVLGTAIVEAKLVSSLVIIVLSASVTANFAFPNYLNTLVIRVMRCVIVVLSGIFGIYGLFAAFLAICLYACSIQRFGIPFMSFLASRKLGQ
ncbi:spore germination protein [Paenibacillus thalictri]|nr:spore germination protein [Paenibacillus thalictri]